MTISALEIKAIASALAQSGELNLYKLLSQSRWSPGLQVLLVEDDEADAYLIRRALAANPRVADVVLAEDGEEALELFDRRKSRANLPSLSGDQAPTSFRFPPSAW